MLNPSIKLLLTQLDLVQNMLEKLEEETNHALATFDFYHDSKVHYLDQEGRDDCDQYYMEILSEAYPDTITLGLTTEKRLDGYSFTLSIKIVPLTGLYATSLDVMFDRNEKYLSMYSFREKIYLLMRETLEKIEAHLQNMIKEITPNVLPSPTQSQSLTTTLFQPRGRQ